MNRSRGHSTSLMVRKIYTGGISGISILPSTGTRYERRLDGISSGHPTYRYKEFTLQEAERPTIIPSVTVYSRNFSYKNYMKTLDMESTLTASFTNTIYPDGRGEEGVSICISLTRKERRDDIDALISSILGVMYKAPMDKPSVTFTLMRSSVDRWRLKLPNYRRLSWTDLSMDTFRQSTMVSPPKGERVFYVQSAYGTFYLDDRNRVTPIDTKIHQSLSVLSGVYVGEFHPVDILIDKDADVRTRPYGERRSMMEGYGLTPSPTLSKPSTPEEFFSFVAGKRSMVIFSPTITYLWEDIVTIRVYVGISSVPMGIEGDTLTPTTLIVTNPSTHIGDVVEVSRGEIVSVSRRPTPMTVSRISSLIRLESDPITMEDLSGRTCSLFTKQVEKVLHLLYSYYIGVGVTGVLDISGDIGHSYWRTPGMTTYLLPGSKTEESFLRGSSATEDDGIIVGEGWEVDRGEVPLVDAVDIVNVPFTIDDLNTYSATSTSYISMLVTPSDHAKAKDHLLSWGWFIDSEYKVSDELLPLDPSCVVDLTLYIWRRVGHRPEVIRLFYNPIAQGTTSKVVSPYDLLYRVGTGGSTVSGGDSSMLESIYLSTDPSFGRRDKIGKTLYMFSNPNPVVKVPLYLIPPDSWLMYRVEGKTTYVYDDRTPREPGVVIFKNKGHWEPLAKRLVNGTYQYIW